MTRGDFLRILAADMRDEARKDCRTGNVYADRHRNTSKTDWDMINLVDFRVLMTVWL